MKELRVENLHTAYGRTPVHHGVTIQVAANEVVGVLGPNGAGKTTLLRAICGQVQTVSGRIVYGDTVLSGMKTFQVAGHGIAVSPEGRKVFGPMTVEENLAIGGYVSTSRGQPPREAFDDVYDIFPVLYERRRSHARDLSGGQQQMLAIGRALMARPSLLLLDEPSLGLAPKLVARVADAVRTAKERLGMSVLLVEQDAGLAFGLSDRVYLTARGVVETSGTPEELQGSEIVRELYLGAAPA